MHPAIVVCEESIRGCGWRKLGGLYFRCDLLPHACGRLPIPCVVCPTCGQGIKPARGYTWVDGDKLKAAHPATCENAYCTACPLHPENPLGRCGLIWIGEQHYPTPAAFLQETLQEDTPGRPRGVSRRIPGDQIPRGFQVGETYILLAHRKAIMTMCECINDYVINGDCPVCNGEHVLYTPGIFQVFRPTRIECVVAGIEPDEVIDRLVERGITPVVVVRKGEQIPF